MVCYHPLKGFVIGKQANGKRLLKVRPYMEEAVYMNGKLYEEYVVIPCGKCLGCKIKRSRDWANRMMLELKDHDKASFVTLTYNDENLPKSQYVDNDGVLHDSYSLRKVDFQLFMKRLRKHYQPEKIRFFACGEYGSKTFRPHYHTILYGVDFSEDRYVHSLDENGYVSYRSPTLEKLWPFGYSMINEVNWNTCAYVSRYVVKKYSDRQKIHYQTFGLEPEFNLMSRRPGIGRNYFDLHKDEIYENQEIFLTNNKGGLKISPPQYFDRLYEIEYPEVMEEIKKDRERRARNVQELKLSKTSLNLLEMLEVEEKYFKDRITTLKREKV